MFDKSKIQIAASGMVGFNTSIHPFYKSLTRHKASSSGYWVNALQGGDFYTIEAMMPSDVKDVNLVVGEKYKIRTAGGNWTNVGADDNNVGTEFVATGTTPTSWGDGVLQLISCNQYLDDIYNEEITHLASRFINNSKEYLKQKTLLSNHSVIGGVADVSKTITKQGRFVGFVLNPHEGNNIVNTITRLGFLGDANDSGLKLYLYETSQDEPIAEFEFDYTTGLSLQWRSVSSDFTIRYDNTTEGDSGVFSGGVGQKYILGYFEDDLTCNAVEMEFNQSLKKFSVFGKYMGVYPIAIPASDLDGYKLPSDLLNLSSHITDTTHGLYFKFTAECDYTNLIVDNIELFAESLQYALAIRILEDAVSSVGQGVHNSTKDASLSEWRRLISRYSGILNGGNIMIGETVKYQKGLIELLTMDFSGIDPVCMRKDPNEWYIGNLI